MSLILTLSSGPDPRLLREVGDLVTHQSGCRSTIKSSTDIQSLVVYVINFDPFEWPRSPTSARSRGSSHPSKVLRGLKNPVFVKVPPIRAALDQVKLMTCTTVTTWESHL